MNALWWFKPEYLFRPSQLIRRIGCYFDPPREQYLRRRLPWGLDIRVRANEVHGEAILHLGVVDLVTTEALWRLAGEGETCLDIGGNIGYTTSVMAKRVGPRGRVIAFEPHPEVYQELEANFSMWRICIRGANLDGRRLALSDRRSNKALQVPVGFDRNRGLCQVLDEKDTPRVGGSLLTVECDTLDNVISAKDCVGVAKLDVEGHEAAVLLGSLNHLSNGTVRDWVFEHHPEYPSQVTNLFEDHGYKVFRLHKTILRPILLCPTAKSNRSPWEPMNFLATRDPDRALARFKDRGWHALRG
jgi:FkbM family methyltransferase